MLLLLFAMLPWLWPLLATLIVWGDADPIIPVEHAHLTHEAIPGSRLEVFRRVL